MTINPEIQALMKSWLRIVNLFRSHSIRFARGSLLAALGLAWAGSISAADRVLIVQDEMPQLEVLAPYLKENGNLELEIVEQGNLPDSLSDYRAVVAFIHGKLEENAEVAIIDYTRNGGRFVCLHHSISSGKAKNRYYFDFLGIRLDNPGQSSQPVKPGGGYGWYHAGEKGVTIALVNLNPNHYITSHKIDWPDVIEYASSDTPSVRREYPGLVLEGTEAYMNHKFTDGREKTVLCGIKFRDPRNGELFMQDRAVWIKPQGTGEIVYILPGDRPSDYENPLVAQLILNAIKY
jgi:hypothetical protein